MKVLPALRGERRDADLSGFGDPFARGQIPPNSYTAGGLGFPVTAESAMRLGAVNACVRVLSDVVSAMPVDSYLDVDGLAKPVPKPKLLIEPMPDQGFPEWMSQGMISALLRGNTYGPITQVDQAGQPSEIMLKNPDDVDVRDTPEGLRYKVGRLGRVEYDAATMMHFRARRMPGSAVGMSPIAYAASTIGLGLSTVKFAGDWFRDGAHPTSTLESDQALTNEEAETILGRLMAKVRRRSREPIVLGAGLHLNQWQVSPNESQFLETIKANRTDIANIYGIPPEMIGGDTSSSMTYSNLEQRGLHLLVFTVDWWLVRWEEFLTRLLYGDGPGYVKFNRSALLRTDATTRWAIIDKRLRNGTMNADEARKLDDEPPLPNGQGQLYLWPPQAPFAGVSGEAGGAARCRRLTRHGPWPSSSRRSTWRSVRSSPTTRPVRSPTVPAPG